MPLVRLPSIHDTSYEPARGPVLLLSCMDLRVLDEIVQFMDHDNLVNRYDHVVLAGAAYGALGAPGGKDEQGNPIDVKHWKKTFFDHLDAAVKLHSVKDVYILQHRNCGAFHKVFHVTKDFSGSAADQAAEKRAHLKYAKALESEIKNWAASKKLSLKTHRFLMDLRGRVDQL
jgi:carbonic anhydrase